MLQKLDQQMANTQTLNQIKSKTNPYFLWEQHNITLIKVNLENFACGLVVQTFYVLESKFWIWNSY